MGVGGLRAICFLPNRMVYMIYSNSLVLGFHMLDVVSPNQYAG